MFFKVNNLSVNYDHVIALDNVSIELAKNQIIALIGANGAGKTTLLRTIAGLVRPKQGTIHFQNEEIQKQAPEAIVRKGIVMVPEGRHIYPFMSVKDNLLMGAYLNKDKNQVKLDMEKCFTIFPKVKERLYQQAGTLSGGEQQMVVMSRAVMARPTLLLMDEPSLGLAPLLIREIAQAILDINKDRGVSIILVEQNSKMALKISSHAYVLETGKVGMEGKSTELINDDHVVKLYLGG